MGLSQNAVKYLVVGCCTYSASFATDNHCESVRQLRCFRIDQSASRSYPFQLMTDPSHSLYNLDIYIPKRGDFCYSEVVFRTLQTQYIMANSDGLTSKYFSPPDTDIDTLLSSASITAFQKVRNH